MAWKPEDAKNLEFRGQYTAIDRCHETEAESPAMARIARVVVPDFPHHETGNEQLNKELRWPGNRKMLKT